MTAVKIQIGYRPGSLGWWVAGHARSQAAQGPFGAVFEAVIEADLAAPLGRLNDPGTHRFRAQ